MVLVAIGVAAFIINYTRQPSSEIQPIRLPAKGEKLEEAKAVEIKEIKDEIKTVTEGEIIKYQEESFYSEGDFSVILKNQEEFKNQLIKRFKEKIIGVEALDCQVDLNDSKKSAVLKCDIKGARFGTNSYNMHFLLNGTKRFGFDLYGFKEVGKKFVYEGKINGITTKIIFEFPYEFGNCHEHVWPRY